MLSQQPKDIVNMIHSFTKELALTCKRFNNWYHTDYVLSVHRKYFLKTMKEEAKGKSIMDFLYGFYGVIVINDVIKPSLTYSDIFLINLNNVYWIVRKKRFGNSRTTIFSSVENAISFFCKLSDFKSSPELRLRYSEYFGFC